jgi:tetratricopeptide (TPR) repeat protein
MKTMFRVSAFIVIALLVSCYCSFAAECTLNEYETLVIDGKAAATGREWGRSVEIYGRILGECRSLVSKNDLATAYDALAVGQLMQENYSVAIDSAKSCLEQEPNYTACMMTAAKAYDGLGDRNMALEFARAAVAVEPYDEYSAASAIYAKDYLRRLEKR